jgi:hypothetical protein
MIVGIWLLQQFDIAAPRPHQDKFTGAFMRAVSLAVLAVLANPFRGLFGFARRDGLIAFAVPALLVAFGRIELVGHSFPQFLPA